VKIGLYDLLPLVIRIRDEQASGAGNNESILNRVVGTVVQDEMDELVALIAGMRNLIQPSLTTDLILAILADYLGVTEFSFSEVVVNKREYVADLVDSHKIRGTLLGILREMNSRNITTLTYIHEMWKYIREPVDEYILDEMDAPYNTAIKAARVVFINDPGGDGPGVGEPIPSDGSVKGIFAVDQVPFQTANQWREQLNNVFPINVIVPVPVCRIAMDDTQPAITDSIAGHVYIILNDQYPAISDGLEIIIQCVASCQVSCQERCETLCELTCETTCETSCQALCEADCQAICQTFCQASCEENCQDSCQEFCQSNCQTLCQSACEVNCQQACQFGCQDASESCQSFCEVNCQTDAEIICDDMCQMTCQSSAQQPCPPGESPTEGGTAP